MVFLKLKSLFEVKSKTWSSRDQLGLVMVLSVLVSAKHVKCNRCGRDAVVRVPYAKLNLCSEHFLEYVENRVIKMSEHYGMFRGVKKVLVALSGGKDSLSLARILYKRRVDLGLEEIYGLHINLGLGEYSETSKEVVENLCDQLGLKCVFLELRKLLGHGLPDLVASSKRPACSLCGLMKRYLINVVAVELGVDAVALGHHLDDLLVFALKNILTQHDLSHLKLAPIARGIPGLLATRLKVLYEVYEDDLKLYADLSGIRYVQVSCPFKYVDTVHAVVRDMLDKLEGSSPGFKISLIRRLTKMFKAEEPPQGISQCKHCGMPSSGLVCSVCRLTERIYGKPMGPDIRARVRELMSSL